MSNMPVFSNNNLFDHFLNSSLDELLAGQQGVTAEDKVLQLFQRCSVEVPAYRQFFEQRLDIYKNKR